MIASAACVRRQKPWVIIFHGVTSHKYKWSALGHIFLKSSAPSIWGDVSVKQTWPALWWGLRPGCRKCYPVYSVKEHMYVFPHISEAAVGVPNKHCSGNLLVFMWSPGGQLDAQFLSAAVAWWVSALLCLSANWIIHRDSAAAMNNAEDCWRLVQVEKETLDSSAAVLR